MRARLEFLLEVDCHEVEVDRFFEEDHNPVYRFFEEDQNAVEYRYFEMW